MLYTFKCKKCGKEYKLELTENRFNKGQFTKYCSISCRNSHPHSEKTKENISKGLKNCERYKNKKKIEKKYFCGTLDLNNKYPEISNHQSSKYFNKFIPFGLDISKLYTVEFPNEYFRIKNLLYNEYIINRLSPKNIFEKYNCKEYFNHSETLLHIFKSFGFNTRSFSDAVENAWLNGNLKEGNIYTQYKCGWHTSWNGKEVYLRSSFELDYANELDKQQIDYEVEYFHIKYFDTNTNQYRCAVPDFYIPSINTIVEIKSYWTLDKQNMKDKMKAYLDLGYNFKLICDHKEIEL